MEKNAKTREFVKELLISAAITVAVAVLMTLLSAAPPLSWVYRWTADRQMPYLWIGLMAGVIAACLCLYHSKKQKRE